MRSDRKIPGNREQRRPKVRPEDRPQFDIHPLYGRIPLLHHSVTGQDGKTRSYLSYDLDYKPELPKGAVRGDPHQQNLCFMCNVPRYFYVDEKKTCLQCGQDFTFEAEEQKFWYERLKFYGTSVAIRCRECRRQRRSIVSLNSQIGTIKRSLKQNPKDPALLLGLAEAIVLFHQKTGTGNLSAAVAAARRVRTMPDPPRETWFWEGAAHAEAGRYGKARQLLAHFVERPPKSKRDRDLQTMAEKYLSNI